MTLVRLLKLGYLLLQDCFSSICQGCPALQLFYPHIKTTAYLNDNIFINIKMYF